MGIEYASTGTTLLSVEPGEQIFFPRLNFPSGKSEIESYLTEGIVRLVDIALKYEGFPAIRYKTPDAGNNPDGFDCSGYVQHVFSETDIDIPTIATTKKKIRHSEEFFDFFGYLIHEQARRPGDLVFFSKNGCRPTHIGIYIGEGNMIHSPGVNGKKVCVRSIDDFCDESKLQLDSRYPQIYFFNPIGYKRAGMPSENRYQRPKL